MLAQVVLVAQVEAAPCQPDVVGTQMVAAPWQTAWETLAQGVWEV